MEISIRQCSESEALEILNDRSIAKLLSVKPESIKDDYVLLIVNEMLLVLAKPEKQSIEIHVACRFRDRAFVRDTMVNGIKWLESCGFTTIWTTAPDSRKGLTKLLESIGFLKVQERWVYGY
jgi:hypothetical protein